MTSYLNQQLSGYSVFHHNPTNLVVHIAAVPVFLLGTLAVPVAIIAGPWWLALIGVAAMAASIGVQGATHKLEDQAVVPFRGPRDVIARLFAEQWITFPRYVVTGGFARAWRESRSQRAVHETLGR